MDNFLVLEEYTRAITVSTKKYYQFLLVKPDADLHGTFTAYDCDAAQFVRVNGALVNIDPID